MMRLLVAALLGVAFAKTAPADTARVGVAISLKEAMTEIAAGYAKQTGERVELSFASSGQVLGQIKNGAPLDAFISAADQQVDELIKAGLADEASRRVIAGNALVLVVPGQGEPAVRGFDGLRSRAVRRVAIGAPDTVPAGRYAAQAFESLGLTAAVREKLVYGSNVRQVLDYVRRGEVEAGIVYRTDAIEARGKVRVVAVARPRTHEPIAYPAVVVRGSSAGEAAGRFLDYLRGPKARAIFAARGFTTGDLPATQDAPREPATRPAR